ncbi:MAG: Coenzyme F420 hydrogenase/dehydrogenase, beta subunit C-terminal domain [Mobilitalea sp.]
MCKNDVYAYKSDNLILKQSSSGGAFTAIVDAVYSIFEKSIANNGLNTDLYSESIMMPIVYGAAFDKNFNVVHKAAYSKEECKQFNGSKYVQSNMGTICIDIMNNLKSNMSVLLTGTPCQVYAVKHYLSMKDINSDNLYLVDIICHGTPDPNLWKAFLIWIEKKYHSKLVNFSFRYKGAERQDYTAMGEFENGIKKINTKDVRAFTTLFFTHLTLRESCYNCKFSNMSRQSDITIGDFWGIEKVMPDFPREGGVSEIIVNTEKGKQLLEIIKQKNVTDENIKLQQCFSDDYIKYQHNLNSPTGKPIKTDQFWSDFEKHGFEYVLKKYTKYGIKGLVMKRFIFHNR